MSLIKNKSINENISQSQIKYKERKKKQAFNPIMLVVFIVLAVYALSIFAVLGWSLLTVFKSTLDFKANPVGLPNYDYIWGSMPDEFSVQNIKGYNFIRALIGFNEVEVAQRSYVSRIFGLIEKPSRDVSIPFALFNTFIYAVLGAFIYAFVSMTVAYMCCKYKYKFSKIIYLTNITVMIIPIVGSQPAMIDMMQTLGLFDSYSGMIFQKINFTGMYFLVFYAFFSGLYDSYAEAAEIDGATQLGIFLRIIVPLSSKMLGTIFLLYFITLWNDYQTPLLYFPTHATISYSLFRVINFSQLKSHKGEEWTGAPQKIAASLILAIPMIIIFCIFSDKIMGDLSMGGVKE